MDSEEACRIKRTYQTRSLCRAAIRRSHEISKTAKPYKCPHCGKFHVATKPRIKREQREREKGSRDGEG